MARNRDKESEPETEVEEESTDEQIPSAIDKDRDDAAVIKEYLENLNPPDEAAIAAVQKVIEQAEGRPRGTIGYRAITRQVIAAYVEHLRNNH